MTILEHFEKFFRYIVDEYTKFVEPLSDVGKELIRVVLYKGPGLVLLLILFYSAISIKDYYNMPSWLHFPLALIFMMSPVIVYAWYCNYQRKTKAIKIDPSFYIGKKFITSKRGDGSIAGFATVLELSNIDKKGIKNYKIKHTRPLSEIPDNEQIISEVDLYSRAVEGSWKEYIPDK